MKEYMNITGVIAVLLSTAGTVKSETAAETSLTQEERNAGYVMLGRLVAAAKRHFTTGEREKFSELIKIGLERDRIHKEHVSAKNKGGRKP